MPKVLLDCLSHEIFWGFLRMCFFFITVPMYISPCQKLFIYVQIISESLGLMADTALSSSWLVWLQQFQLQKNNKRSMIHDVKCKGMISSYFRILQESWVQGFSRAGLQCWHWDILAVSSCFSPSSGLPAVLWISKEKFCH